MSSWAAMLGIELNTIHWFWLLNCISDSKKSFEQCSFLKTNGWTVPLDEWCIRGGGGWCFPKNWDLLSEDMMKGGWVSTGPNVKWMTSIFLPRKTPFWTQKLSCKLWTENPYMVGTDKQSKQQWQMSAESNKSPLLDGNEPLLLCCLT